MAVLSALGLVTAGVVLILLMGRKGKAVDDPPVAGGWKTLYQEEQARATHRAREIEEWRDRYAAERRRADEEERKRLEQFQLIEGIQRERDGWKNELLRCGRGYSVGQALLMREIQRLSRLSKRPIKSEALAFAEKFSSEYGPDGIAKIAGRIEAPPLAEKSSGDTESVAKEKPSA